MAEPARLLLAESIPEALRRSFSASLVVETVRYRGCTGRTNGDLLRAAEAHFDVLVTVDKGLRHQQNVGARDLGVIVVDAGGTTVEDLRPLVPAIEAAVRTVQPGRVVVVAR